MDQSMIVAVQVLKNITLNFNYITLGTYRICCSVAQVKLVGFTIVIPVHRQRVKTFFSLNYTRLIVTSSDRN